MMKKTRVFTAGSLKKGVQKLFQSDICDLQTIKTDELLKNVQNLNAEDYIFINARDFSWICDKIEGDKTALSKKEVKFEGVEDAFFHKLITGDKLLFMGQMMGELTHEMNNYFATMRICTEDILSGLEKDSIDREAVKKTMKIYQTYVDKFSNFIHILGAFSNPHLQKGDRIDLNQTLKNSLKMLEWFFEKKRIKINQKLYDGEFSYFADYAEFEQLFLSLLTFAKDSVLLKEETGKEISLESGYDKNTLYVKIRDNGPGVLNDVTRGLLNPMSGDDEQDPAYSIGLSLVNYVVHKYKGHLDVESGKSGSAFTVCFPKK
ncbi:MAG: HAMP domain-containing sensor histidine kinase [Pseudomonadota bacterium]